MEYEDEPPPRKQYPLSPSKMSKTPSWIMLGFVLGALFVFALPPLREKPAAKNEVPARVFEPPKPEKPPEPPQLSTIEAVFAEWGDHAVWAGDTTEVALWNVEKRAYADFYEVRRFDGGYFFRTIPRLTRRIIARGKPMPDSPLQFTETEEQYQEWRQHGRTERPQPAELYPPPRSAPARGPDAIKLEPPKVQPPPLEAPVVPRK